VGRPALIAALVAGAMAVAGVVLLVAGGDNAEPAAPPRTLVWAAAPRLATANLLYGQVRNEGERAIVLHATALRVLDAAGRRLPATARFQQAYAPGPHGGAVTLAPGASAPLTVAWRGAGARSIALGGVRLPVAVAP